MNGGPINPATAPVIDRSITLPNGQSIQGSNSNIPLDVAALTHANPVANGAISNHFESLNRLSNMLTGIANNKEDGDGSGSQGGGSGGSGGGGGKQRNVMDIELTREEIERQDKLSRTIYVGNLNPMIQQEHIQDFFSVCGSIEIVKVAGNASQPTVARYAFVEFTNVESARAAYRLSGLSLIVVYIVVLFVSLF